MLNLSYQCCLGLIVSLFTLSYSTHFRGGILGWRPAEQSNTVIIFWQVAWRRSFDPATGCDYRQERKSGEGELRCVYQRRECDPVLIHDPLEFVCTDFNEIADWSTGVGSLRYTYGLQNQFTIQYAPIGNSYWVLLQNYGDATLWRLVTTVDMSVRSDTGRPNSSPTTSMIPVIKVQKGCTSTINIPAQDPDGDVVKCRWTDANKNECPREMYGRHVCGTMSPHSVLDEDLCQIRFDTTSVNPGWYAVSVMIEDFRSSDSTEALSKIPLQFLIDVFPHSPECKKPTIIAPIGSCEILRPEVFWQMSIRARQGREYAPITDISTSTPRNIDKTSLGPYPGSETDFLVTLSWTPTYIDLGHHFVCFFATDADGVSTDQQCVTLVVTVDEIRSSPSLFQEGCLPNPEYPISANAEELIIAFDSEIQKPEMSSYVRISKFRPNGEERIIRQYDTSSSSFIYFPPDQSTIFKVNISDLNLRSERIYVIDVDAGAALARYGDPCSANKANDAARWIFETEPIITTAIPTTTVLTKTTTSTPPTPEAITEPVAECSSTGLRVFVPTFIVGNVQPSHLHFNDPACRGKIGNNSGILMETAYDSCGTIKKVKTSDLIKYRNTIFAEPISINNTRITRDREIQINIVCDVTAGGIIHAVFEPDVSAIVLNIRETASFNFALRMYHDYRFSDAYTILDYPIPVELRQELYFSARASNPNMSLTIDSCKATPEIDPGPDDYYYFIYNSCIKDETTKYHLSPSLSEVRFSVDAFEFHRHGVSNAVYVSCDVYICSQNDVYSACLGGCPDDDVVNVGTGRGDAQRKRRSSAGEQANKEIEHSARIPLVYKSDKDQNNHDKRHTEEINSTAAFDITLLVVNVCLFFVVSVASIIGIKLARSLNTLSQRNAFAKSSAQTKAKKEATFDNQSYVVGECFE